MSDDLHFMMGKFRAEIPADRLYSKRHLWLQQTDDGSFRVGLTAWSVRLLQDVYFLEWTVAENSPVQDRQEVGEVESSKAMSSLYAPASGTLLEFNHDVLSDPSAINADNYGKGWLFTMNTDATLLSPEDYLSLLKDSWEDTQRTIKGQLN